MQQMNQPDDAGVIPPAPWRLQGLACLSLWRVLPSELGVLSPDPALPLFTLAGSAFVATIWARYTGGTLRYNELAVAVLVRGRGLLAPAASVTAIWVDDAVSAEGGRRLWHIPKALAHFASVSEAGQVFSGSMTLDGEPAAQMRFKPRMSLPGRPALSGFVIQPGSGGPLRTRCTVSGKLRIGRAHWEFATAGPLGSLQGRKPLVSVCINEMDAEFGV